MTKMTNISALAAFALLTSACSGEGAPDADDVTETQMDDVEVIDGTISDDMVDVDAQANADGTGETESSSDARDDAAAEEAATE